MASSPNANIGEIKIEFHDAFFISDFDDSVFMPGSFSEPVKVHEKSKEVFGHQIGCVLEFDCIYKSISYSTQVGRRAAMC
jgi:hypothetical protein